MMLENKVAIVTGATAGSATPSRSSSPGRALGHGELPQERGRRRRDAQGDRGAGGKAQDIQADVSTVAEIGKLVDETVAAYGRLDIMVNNAGMETRTSTLETTEHQFDMVIAIDLKSAFFGVQAAAKQMIKQGGGGRIINISSIHEDWPMPGNAPYCLAKGGVRMLTRTAGVELAPHGITVVGVAPGAVHTPIDEVTLADPAAKAKLESAIPLGRVAEPDEIARLVAFLASDDASYGTATTYVVDGGMMQASVGSRDVASVARPHATRRSPMTVRAGPSSPARPSARRHAWSRAGSTCASIRSARPGSTCCCSTVRTTSSRAGSSASTRTSTGPASTGTRWCPPSGRVSCTPSRHTDRGRPRPASGSTRPACFSTHTAAASSCPTATGASRPGWPIRPPRR